MPRGVINDSTKSTMVQAFWGSFSFPHPVNEVAARWVAGMVVALTLTIIVTDLYWLMFVHWETKNK